MRIVLDTNYYTAWDRMDPEATQLIASAAEIFFPFVVIGELASGFLSGNRRDYNFAALARFTQAAGARVLHSDTETVSLFASLSDQLRR